MGPAAVDSRLGEGYNRAMGEDAAGRWLEQAGWDLKAAGDSAAAGNYEWACFQAQQAAEKALKSYLIAAGRSRVVSHSVRLLLVECERLEPGFSGIRAAAELDRYYVPTRYPDGLPGDIPHAHFDAEAAERCRSLALSVIEFVSRSSRS